MRSLGSSTNWEEFSLRLTCPARGFPSTPSTVWMLCWRLWGKRGRQLPISARRTSEDLGSPPAGWTKVGRREQSANVSFNTPRELLHAGESSPPSHTWTSDSLHPCGKPACTPRLSCGESTSSPWILDVHGKPLLDSCHWTWTHLCVFSNQHLCGPLLFNQGQLLWRMIAYLSDNLHMPNNLCFKSDHSKPQKFGENQFSHFLMMGCTNWQAVTNFALLNG